MKGYARHNLRVRELRYGHYAPEEFRAALHTAQAMVFVCEHETQGIAYQEALASGVPLLAWDHAGEWLDPNYHPHRIRYGPISSVPYFDGRCGLKFRDAAEFTALLPVFQSQVKRGGFAPRDYILENLTLEKCAAKFVDIVQAVTRR